MTNDLRWRTSLHEASHATCALAYGIPIVRVCITANTPHLRRGDYRPPPGIGLQAIVTLCLAGPAGEEYFCGRVNDGGDETDIEMAREYLARYCDPVLIGAGLAQGRDAAERLVRTAWAEQRIRLLADALLQRGTLSGEDIEALA